jgi:hypothetical protein
MTKSFRSRVPLAFTAGLMLLLVGCASAPTGPSMLVLPGTGRSFDNFRLDDMDCRQYASGLAAAASQGATEGAVRGAALGTVVGTIAGAAIDGSRGAGVGAGTGLIVGAASGSSQGGVLGRDAQRQYDNAYVQCMYSKGHRVPVDGRLGEMRQQAPVSSPAAGSAPPPPPPGSPPPPPAGVVR